MNFLLILLIAACYFFLSMDGHAISWKPMVPKQALKSKGRLWQVAFTNQKGVTITYVIQSAPAQIRIFYHHTKYHHPIFLHSFGIDRLTDVGLAQAVKEEGQVLYLGDQTTQRMLSINLGKKKIRDVPLMPGLKAYKEFVAQMHPVAEAERYF